MHELERADDDLVGAAGRVAVTARQGPAAVVTMVRRRRGAVRGAVRRERDRAHARHGDALGVERGAHDVVDRVDGGADEHVRQLLAGRRRHLRALVEALRLEVEEQVAAALRLRARADVDVDHARALLLGGGSVVGDDERDLRLRVELVAGTWGVSRSVRGRKASSDSSSSSTSGNSTGMVESSAATRCRPLRVRQDEKASTQRPHLA